MVDEAQREELKVREGESPEEWKARVDGLSDKWAQEHCEKLRAERKGRHEERSPSGSSELSMASRAKGQERGVERAISEFEAAKKQLYRGDGTQVYAGEEHAERLEKLTAELREQVEAVVREAPRRTPPATRGRPWRSHTWTPRRRPRPQREAAFRPPGRS